MLIHDPLFGFYMLPDHTFMWNNPISTSLCNLINHVQFHNYYLKVTTAIPFSWPLKG